ncbi:MAG: hypothetical protein K1Y02_05230 [Candidatus Hydrogenedentes bacterium]|nr:hypothetical protein [Candidatus Hydrogenedentota bacterium]
MNARNWIRNLLLLFAVGSVFVFLGREAVDRQTTRKMNNPSDISTDDLPVSAKLIVYYFDEGKDCSTCLNIPEFTKDALDTHFKNELSSGDIVWRAVDVEESRNAHFITDYSLYTKSVVLVRVNDGKQVRWKNLDKVWDLVYDKPAFLDYIREQVREDLDTPP